MSNTAVVDFEFVNLSEIDPSFNAIYPEGVYDLKVIKMEQVERIAKQGPNKGVARKAVNVQLAITNHESLNGRRLFETFYPSDFTLKIFRRLTDATGVHQSPGTPLTEWFGEMTQVQPEFKTKVQEVDDVDFTTGQVRTNSDGTPVKKNKINWFEVMPA